MAQHDSYRRLCILNICVGGMVCLFLVTFAVRSWRAASDPAQDTVILADAGQHASTQTRGSRPFRIYSPGGQTGPGSRRKVLFGQDALSDGVISQPAGPPPELVENIKLMAKAGQLEPMIQQQEAALMQRARRSGSDDQDNQLNEERVKGMKQSGAVAW